METFLSFTKEILRLCKLLGASTIRFNKKFKYFCPLWNIIMVGNNHGAPSLTRKCEMVTSSTLYTRQIVTQFY